MIVGRAMGTCTLVRICQGDAPNDRGGLDGLSGDLAYPQVGEPDYRGNGVYDCGEDAGRLPQSEEIGCRAAGTRSWAWSASRPRWGASGCRPSGCVRPQQPNGRPIDTATATATTINATVSMVFSHRSMKPTKSSARDVKTSRLQRPTAKARRARPTTITGQGSPLQHPLDIDQGIGDGRYSARRRARRLLQSSNPPCRLWRRP